MGLIPNFLYSPGNPGVHLVLLMVLLVCLFFIAVIRRREVGPRSNAAPTEVFTPPLSDATPLIEKVHRTPR